MRQTKKLNQVILLGIVSLLSLSFGIWAFSRGKQSVTTKSTGKQIKRVVSIASPVTGQTNISREIFVNLRGMQEQDIISLRPAAEKIDAAAIRLIKNDCSSCKDSNRLQVGPDLPESILTVTPAELTFDRPYGNEDVVVLDIEVPHNISANVSNNGKPLLVSKIDKAIVFKKGAWLGGEGIDSRVKLYAWSLIPMLQEKGFPAKKAEQK